MFNLENAGQLRKLLEDKRNYLERHHQDLVAEEYYDEESIFAKH